MTRVRCFFNNPVSYSWAITAADATRLRARSNPSQTAAEGCQRGIVTQNRRRRQG